MELFEQDMVVVEEEQVEEKIGQLVKRVQFLQHHLVEEEVVVQVFLQQKEVELHHKMQVMVQMVMMVMMVTQQRVVMEALVDPLLVLVDMVAL